MPAFVCHENNASFVKQWLSKVFEFYRMYKYLGNAYVVEFYTRDHWQKLPPLWQKALDNVPPERLADWILKKSWTLAGDGVVPLSLQCYLLLSDMLSLCRHPSQPQGGAALRSEVSQCLSYMMSGGGTGTQHSTQHAPPTSSSSQCNCLRDLPESWRNRLYFTPPPTTPRNDDQPPATEACRNMPPSKKKVAKKQKATHSLPHCFRKHIKPKKLHEIERMAQVVSEVVSHTGGGGVVVDVGAGHGHLSRLLSLHHRVTSIDCDSRHTLTGSQYDDEARYYVAHKLRGESESDTTASLHHIRTPHHVTHRISTDITTREFVALVAESINNAEVSGSVDRDASIVKSDKPSGVKSDEAQSVCGDEAQSAGSDEAQSVCRDEAQSVCRDEAQSVCNDGAQSARSDGAQSARSDGAQSVCRDEAQSVCSDEAQNVCNDEFHLIGLHACADLSPTIITLYTESPQCRSVACVGCCYMRLSESYNNKNSETSSSRAGYPLSDYVRALQLNIKGDPHGYIKGDARGDIKGGGEDDIKGGGEDDIKGDYTLGYDCRELACHTLDTYLARLQACRDGGGEEEDGYKVLYNHSWRALLELLVQRHSSPHSPHTPRPTTSYRARLSDRVKHRKYTSLHSYLSSCLCHLGLAQEISVPISELEQTFQATWRRVVAFYTLRLLLAPVIETCLLLDRLIFLHERGHAAALLPTFSPLVSPRNHLLISCKHKHDHNEHET